MEKPPASIFLEGKMRVRMRVDYVFYPDGINKRELKAGEVVDVKEDVAKDWLAEGKAIEDKMMGTAPEVKVEVEDMDIKVKGEEKRKRAKK